MKFGFNERTDSSTYIQFYNTDAIEGVHKINEFKEYDLYGDFISREFKYSFDNLVWSSFADLNPRNISSVNLKQTDLWLIIKYSRTTEQDASIGSFFMIYNN